MCTTENSDYTPFLACSFIGFFGYVVVYVAFIAHVLWRVNTLARTHKDYVPSTVDADETTDPSEEEEDEQFERMIRRTHPDIQLLIRRFGLLFLPYSQRTWSWEIVAMARKSPMALTAVFFTTTPILQLELMLAQNVSWLALLIWFRPFTVVPLMGGPLEKIYEDERIGQAEQRWSSGSIVEIGMSCGTVALNIIGLTIGDGDSTAQLAFFFAQLGVVGVLITRAIQSVGDESVPFFGSVGDRIWETVEGAAEKLHDFMLSRLRHGDEEANTLEEI